MFLILPDSIRQTVSSSRRTPFRTWASSAQSSTWAIMRISREMGGYVEQFLEHPSRLLLERLLTPSAGSGQHRLPLVCPSPPPHVSRHRGLPPFRIESKRSSTDT
jgi:hypothetical protein